jgi:hypothetical protein
MNQTRTLADLRPNATIQCYYCDKPKPQAGSQKFYAHLVCAPCAQKLRALPEKEKK